MSDEPKHERLSQALCEAVEFGRPTKIRLGHADMAALIDSLGALHFHKLGYGPLTFEGVRLSVERGVTGCVVEHDNCYTAPSACLLTAVPETVAMMRDTLKPAIVAW